MRQYSRVTYEDRCHISAWLQENVSISEISKRLGFHKSTVYREIQRNSSSEKVYNPGIADFNRRYRFQRCRKPYRLTGELLETVDLLLRKDWSPEQISNRIRIEGKNTISHECIYAYVRKNKDTYRPHLRRLCRRSGVGRYLQKGKHKHSFQPNISIRPPAANIRSEFGHLERDIMFAGNKTPILVCLDRKSRYIAIGRVADLKAATVNELTLQLVKSLPFKTQTVTSDRGTEFKIPLKQIKTYYCDPQAPQQRGSVENVIGLIRQYIKRKTKPERVTQRLLSEIENKLNTRPRKTLDFLSPDEVVHSKRVALAT